MTERRSNLTGMKQNRSKANMVSLKHVWWWQLKSQPVSFDEQTLTDISAYYRNIADKLNLTDGNKFPMKLKSALPSHPHSLVGRPCCWLYMISVNKERSSDLINHSIWLQSTPKGSLIISLPRVRCSFLRGCIHFHSGSLLSLLLSSSFTPIQSSLFS